MLSTFLEANMPIGVFALAEPSEARTVAKAASKGKVPGTVTLHGMTLIDLVTLAAVLDPAYDAQSALDSAIRITNGAAVPVAPQLHSRLAALKAKEIGAISETWS